MAVLRRGTIAAREAPTWLPDSVVQVTVLEDVLMLNRRDVGPGGTLNLTRKGSKPAGGGKPIELPKDGGKAGDASKLAGTWEGPAKGGLKQVWTFRNEDDRWSVAGVVKKGDEVVGSFQGGNVRHLPGTQQVLFEQKFDKLPPGWTDRLSIGASATEKELQYLWATSGLTVTRETGNDKLTRAKAGTKPVPTPEPEPAPRDPGPKPGPAEEKGLVGTWEGRPGGLTALLTFKEEKGEWSMTCVFKRGDKEVGSSHGEKCRMDKGRLTFVQIFDKNPLPDWRDGNEIAVTAKGDRADYTWNDGQSQGSGSWTRVKAGK